MIRPLSSQCDMQKLTVDELKRLLYDTFRDHLTMKDIENIIMTEENHLNSPESHVDIESMWPIMFVSHTFRYLGGVLLLRDVLIFLRKSFRSEPNTTGEAHVRAQKPDLCLRHCVHHQRYAHRCKSNAPQRDEVNPCFRLVAEGMKDGQPTSH